MTTLDIVRPTTAGDMDFCTIKPSDSSTQTKQVMGDNKLTITFEDSRNLPFQINDYCMAFGEKYILQTLPVVTKVSRYLYQYTLIFDAVGLMLSRAQYLFLGSDNSLRESDFSLMGNASDFIDLLITNANRVGIVWTKGQVIPTGYKNISFATENCYNALSKIAEEFETEFAIEGTTIHLVKRATDTGHTYKHGRNKGLYQITRQTLNNSAIVTRLYAYGSEKNLPANYISTGKRLRLPGGYNPCLISGLTCIVTDNGDGTTTFAFEWIKPLSTNVTAVQIEWRLIGDISWTVDSGAFETPPPREVTLDNGSYEFQFRTVGTTCSGINAVTPVIAIAATISSPVLVYAPLPFIERNVAVYGVCEHTEIFEDIFPHRDGRVSAVNVADVYEFTDSLIDFDVNAYLLPGLTAKVTFNTGQLAGYTFNVESFNNSTKKFRIQKNAEERILDIPSATLKPAIGDLYVLTDVEMPAGYVTAAEIQLRDAANARLIELSEPQLSYTVTIDPAFMRRVGRTIGIGDLVWIVDTELEIQRKIRITSFTRNLLNEYQYTVELSDLVTPGTISRIVSAQQSADGNIRDLGSQFTNNSILNNNVIGTLTFTNMPTTPTLTGFDTVVMEQATGKLFRKV